jgi:excinuclease UvrABC ATPase subunit
MTKKLEELLNLPESQEIVKEEKEKAEAQDKQQEQKAKSIQAQKDTMRDIAEFDKIAAALPKVDGLGEMGDTELDDISNKASTAYEDLMDLGMNVESRYSARIFEVAGQMLKTNLEAKTAKLDKKKQKQDQKTGDVDSNVISGEGYVVSDRNSLIEKLKNLDKYNKDGNNDKDDK